MEKENYLLVTGASSGIGKAIALKLSEHYNVVISGRNIERLSETQQRSSNCHKVLIWQYDLEKIDSLEKDLTDYISENNISISGFIHCAGYMKLLPLKMITPAYFQSSLNINLISASLITKTLTSKKANQAALNNVVFISSNISNYGAKAMSVYGATKGGLDSLMRCLAVELAPKVRVNSVLPGAVKTEMTALIYDNKEIIDRINDTYPLGLGTPNDICGVVSFLLSDEARWITGQQFTVDGGRTINITG